MRLVIETRGSRFIRGITHAFLALFRHIPPPLAARDAFFHSCPWNRLDAGGSHHSWSTPSEIVKLGEGAERPVMPRKK